MDRQPQIGRSVVHMQSLDLAAVSDMFVSIDVFANTELNARFDVSHLGEMSVIRSLHATRDCGSQRLERHMSDKDGGFAFVCMPLVGGIEFRHHGQSCSLTPGAMTLVRSGEEFRIRMSDELDMLWLRMPERLLQAHVLGLGEVLGRRLDCSNAIGTLARQMMQAPISDEADFGPLPARLLAQSLLGFIAEIVNDATGVAGASAHRHKIYRRACDYIDAHIGDETLSPREIATGIGISPRYLSEIFAAEGSSPMRWLQARRLERSRMELERCGEQGLLIREVAYAMGFANVSSFNRAFKSHFGQPPGCFTAAPARKH